MNKALLLMRIDQIVTNLIDLDRAGGTRTTPPDIAAALGALRPLKINLEHHIHDRAFDAYDQMIGVIRGEL